MFTLVDLFPDVNEILLLEPEELGDVILELIHQKLPTGEGMFTMNDVIHSWGKGDVSIWTQGLRSEAWRAVSEAMSYLQTAGMTIQDLSQSHSTTWLTLTRRGRMLKTRRLAVAFREAAVLPIALIHPDILAKAHSAFVRGDYDISVLSAFKTIEVAVRRQGGYAEGELGTKLMRRAFEVNKGPLADSTLDAGEQQAQSDLFAGAIGAAKNPASHREVEMTRQEAARLILFASYLMSIVEARPAEPSSRI